MSHDHNHGHQHDSTGNIKVAFFLNLTFTIVELIGGLLTNSIAIIADALHDLGDSLSLGMAWYLQGYAEKPSSERYSYGYRRFSLLGALINTVVLLGGGLFILSETVPRLMNPEPTYAPGMLGFALLGIGVNGIAVLRLRGGSSLNEQVVSWHLLEDVLGWVAVLIVSIILLFTDLYILDPLLSILITLYILYNVIGNLRRTLAVFLQATPEQINLPEIEHKLLNIEHITSTHHTHIWSLDGEHHVMSTHVVVPDEATRDEVCNVKAQVVQLSDDLGCEHVTIEVEFESEPCRLREHRH